MVKTAKKAEMTLYKEFDLGVIILDFSHPWLEQQKMFEDG